MTVTMYETAEEVYTQVAAHLVASLQTAIVQRGEAVLIAAGGSTFLPIYNLLAQEYAAAVDWETVHIFMGDERMVPEDSPLNNSAMIKRELLEKLPEDHQPHFYPIITETEASAAASAYHVILPEQVDVSLLGLGTDGHSASLFSASKDQWLSEEVIVVEAELQPLVTRVSLTPAFFNRSKEVLVVVLGSEKAEILQKVLHDSTKQYPLSYINEDTITIVVDALASA